MGNINPDNDGVSPSRTSSGIVNRLLLASIVVGVVGVSVTGTLLWVDNQPKSTAQPQNPSVTSAPQMPMPIGATPLNAGGMTPPGSMPKPDSDSQHQPPASLTAGMPPVQVALTLGNWYFDHEAWSNAIAQYRKAIGMGLDNPDIRTDYGSALRFSGQPQKALEQYQLAHKQDSRHENSLFNQGGVYASEFKAPAKAIAAWQQYIKEFPTGKSVAQAKLLIEREQGKLKAS